MKSKQGFTLIELLIVTGIVAVLGSVLVLIIRPAELFRQARDSQRLTEMNAINEALVLYNNIISTSSSSPYMGIPDTPYSSIPSDAVGGCPSGYTCNANIANYRKTDGTGWIPVPFTDIQDAAGTIFSSLPIDPINTSANNLFYTYVPGGSWALSAALESEKYLAQMSSDGGISNTRFEVGTDLALNSYLGGGGAPPSSSCSATGGNTVEDIGGYRIHTFTSSGTLNVTQGCDVEVLVVGGGGGGGPQYNGGGGGAGGYQYNAAFTVTTGAYTVTVGNGGQTIVGAHGVSGGNSVFSTITAIGGGGGGYHASQDGYNGGSGGGGSDPNIPLGIGGTGSQGYNGGNGYGQDGASGGGGGAGGAGQNGYASHGGNGGVGVVNPITGSTIGEYVAGQYWICGGGGASGRSSSSVEPGAGGKGGGGVGSVGGAAHGIDGTGGGGGGTGAHDSMASRGGSGVVIVKYPL